MADATVSGATSEQLGLATPAVGLAAEDLAELRLACEHLEHPSLAARLTSVIGTPIEIGVQLLPRRWYKGLHGVAEAAIGKALDSALSSMRRAHEISAHERYYKALVAGSGAVGGLLGLPGLLLELPVTTTLMLRSIAEIARDQGEDVHTEAARAACLEVFALGGRSELDDAAETGYYGVRLALASYLTLTGLQVSRATLAGEATPTLVRLIQGVSARFGADLTTRAAARALPLVGAAGAATVNLIFMQHFQDMARGHFTVRRLERRYGPELVKANYEHLAANL
jgi:hypothetical protein